MVQSLKIFECLRRHLPVPCFVTCSQRAKYPDPSQIPDEDLVGVTVILLTCSYKDREFVRVGYYVNNEYIEEEMRENPPTRPVIEKLQRNILHSKPRVTRFKIDWND